MNMRYLQHFTNTHRRIISKYPKTAYVGSSSRKLPLSGELNLAGSPGGYGKPKPRYVRV
jgi:hypothetical protein